MGSHIDLDGVIYDYAVNGKDAHGRAPGDVRLWIRGRRSPRPIILIRKAEPQPDGEFWDRWVARTIPDNKKVLVFNYDIGKRLTDMEVLAWSAK
jgi:hypothetical protein